MPSSLWDAIDDLPAMTYIPDVAKLLSASSYPTAPSNVSASTRSDEQLLYGIVPTEDSAEEDANNPRPTKRAKPTKDNMSRDKPTTQGGPKRQRGRPKVSTRDETATERRRTQIRLAQRAYRNRKENTITDLTQRVESLEATIKSTNTGFARLRENLLNSGMIQNNSVMARQISALMQNLHEALESPPSDADRGSEGEESEPQRQVQGRSRADLDTSGANTTPMALQGQQNSVSSWPVASFQIGADQSIFDLEEHRLTGVQSQLALPTNSRSFSAFKTDTRPPANNQRALTSIERFPLKESYTYSFQESTFARRLHRLTIERAYQMLLSPHTNPEWMLKVFRFTFNFSTRDRMKNAFKAILARGTDEPLENWKTPFIHIGGAGLHFPRYDADGQPVYPPNLWAPGNAASAWRIPNPETIPSANTLEAILESVGFGGVWFDSHDVEEYLKTKGIYPEPQASFMVVNSALAGLPAPLGTDTVGTIASGSSPGSQNSGQMLQGYHNATKPGRSLPQEDAFSEVPTFTDEWLDRQQTYNANDFDVEFSESTYAIATRETRLLTIEVEKFLERLVDESVCLGRAPGFRKEHVDNALVLAVQEAF